MKPTKNIAEPGAISAVKLPEAFRRTVPLKIILQSTFLLVNVSPKIPELTPIIYISPCAFTFKLSWELEKETSSKTEYPLMDSSMDIIMVLLVIC